MAHPTPVPSATLSSAAMSGPPGADAPAAPRAKRGFGVAAMLDDATLQTVARTAEAAGYDTFWVNDSATGEGLAALRAAAEATSAMRMAVGLIPLDRRSPQQIAARIGELDLPGDRLIVGVGSGAAPGGLARVADGVATLRRLIDAMLVVGALGPRMRRLAAEVADGVLLDWPTPAYAAACVDEIAYAAAAAGRARPTVGGYVFTALGAAALRRLETDARYYGAVPAYAAHFDRMGADPLDATAGGRTPEEVQRALAAFDVAWDETVVRATVESDTADAHLSLLTAAAPRDGRSP